MSGWTLGLDTATPATVAAAIGPDGRTAARIDVPAPGDRPGHTRLLLGLAEEVLAATGGAWAQVDRIVVGLGPGTFTGIRVGVATGRALALTHGAHAVGVPTPAALAEAAGGPEGTHAGRPVLVVQDARRRELFLTALTTGLPAEEPVAPWTVPQADLAEALAELHPLPAVAVGDGALAFAEVLRAAGVEVPEDPAAHAVDGLALIRAATRRAPVGTTPGGDDATASGSVGRAAITATSLAAADLVRPLYVRDADAVPTAERR